MTSALHGRQKAVMGPFVELIVKTLRVLRKLLSVSMARTKKCRKACIVGVAFVASLGLFVVPAMASQSVHVASIVAVHNAQPPDHGVVESQADTSQLEAAAVPTSGSVAEGYGFRITYSDGSFDYVGWYWVKDPNTGKWFRAYCVTPDAGLSQGQHFTLVTSLSGHGSTAFNEITYVLVNYGTPNASVPAAANSQAVNHFFGNNTAVSRRAPHLSSAVRDRTALVEKNAEKFHGPYKRTLSCVKLLPGQTGQCTLTITSAAGNGVPNIKFHLAAGNVNAPSSVTTGPGGNATFSIKRLSQARLSLKATSVRPQADGHLWKGNPANGQQLMLSPAKGKPIVIKLAYQRTATLAKPRVECTGECLGKPPVVYHVCHAAGEATRTYVLTNNGKAVTKVTIKRSNNDVCKDVTGIVPDTHSASLKCQYSFANGTHSAYAQCGKTIVVDCPPWPVIHEENSCACGKGTADLSVPASTTNAYAINYRVLGSDGTTWGPWVQVIEAKGTSTCQNKYSHAGDTTCVVHVPFDRSVA